MLGFRVILSLECLLIVLFCSYVLLGLLLLGVCCCDLFGLGCVVLI